MKCEGCGSPRALDRDVFDDHGIAVWEWSCECISCTRCRRRFHPDDADGPSLASSDAEARRHGEPHCFACWGALAQTEQEN